MANIKLLEQLMNKITEENAKGGVKHVWRNGYNSWGFFWRVW